MNDLIRIARQVTVGDIIGVVCLFVIGIAALWLPHILGVAS